MVSAADQAFKRLRCVYCYRSGRLLLLRQRTGFQMMIWSQTFKRLVFCVHQNELLCHKMPFLDAGMAKEYSHMWQGPG